MIEFSPDVKNPACGHQVENTIQEGENARRRTLYIIILLKMEMAIYHTGGVFSYLPHHLDLALEDSVGHSTCMSVLARRRAIMGLGLGGAVGGFLAVG